LVFVIQAKKRAAKRSPVPVKDAGNLGMLTEILTDLEPSFNEASASRFSLSPSSVDERITVLGPLACSVSIAFHASSLL
jgi:hypothetical protein